MTGSTNAYTTILDLPVATTVSGSESFWIVQGGVDRRTTISAAAAQSNIFSSDFAPIPPLTVLANNSSITSLGPSAYTLTEVFDANYGVTQNLFLTRGTTGWLPRLIIGADLPNPQAGALGGVLLSTNPANQWMTGITATGSASYTTIPASQLVQGITGSSSSPVVLSKSPRLYSPGLDASGFLYTSTATGSAITRPLVGNFGGYNAVFSQGGGVAIQVGSTIAAIDGGVQDPTTYFKQENGFVFSNNAATSIYASFLAAPNGMQLYGSTDSLTITTVRPSTATANALFPTGTYTLARSSNVIETLTANRQYYVSSRGADTNTGLGASSSLAWATVQYACNTCAAFNLSIYQITIQLTSGAGYPEALVLPEYVGTGPIVIKGSTNTTSSDFIINPVAGNCIGISQNSRPWSLLGLKLTAPVGGNCISCNVNSQITYGYTIFDGGGRAYDISATLGGRVTLNSAFVTEIVSNTSASGHYYAESGGYINAVGSSFLVNSSRATGNGFVYVVSGGTVSAAGSSYRGSSMTGPRFNMAGQATIFTGGAGTLYFPGDALVPGIPNSANFQCYQ